MPQCMWPAKDTFQSLSSPSTWSRWALSCCIPKLAASRQFSCLGRASHHRNAGIADVCHTAGFSMWVLRIQTPALADDIIYPLNCVPNPVVWF